MLLPSPIAAEFGACHLHEVGMVPVLCVIVQARENCLKHELTCRIHYLHVSVSQVSSTSVKELPGLSRHLLNIIKVFFSHRVEQGADFVKYVDVAWFIWISVDDVYPKTGERFIELKADEFGTRLALDSLNGLIESKKLDFLVWHFFLSLATYDE